MLCFKNIQDTTSKTVADGEGMEMMNKNVDGCIYKMSDNDGWNAEDNNFDADVLIQTDRNKHYQGSKVVLTRKNKEEISAIIHLTMQNNHYYAELEILDKLGKIEKAEIISTYAKSLEDYSRFMLKLVEEANVQLHAIDGIFSQKQISYSEGK